MGKQQRREVECNDEPGNTGFFVPRLEKVRLNSYY